MSLFKKTSTSPRADSAAALLSAAQLNGLGSRATVTEWRVASRSNRVSVSGSSEPLSTSSRSRSQSPAVATTESTQARRRSGASRKGMMAVTDGRPRGRRCTLPGAREGTGIDLGVLVSSGEGGDDGPAPLVSGDLAGRPAAEDLGHVGDGPAALGQPEHQVVLPVPPGDRAEPAHRHHRVTAHGHGTAGVGPREQEGRGPVGLEHRVAGPAPGRRRGPRRRRRGRPRKARRPAARWRQGPGRRAGPAARRPAQGWPRRGRRWPGPPACPAAGGPR